MTGKQKVLIETTIVVMVISLLLLVSIPQFLEAQHRVKVTGILQQMENVRLAFNSYIWNTMFILIQTEASL